MAVNNSSTRANSSAQASKQRPAYEARFGLLKATVWRQESNKGPWYSVVLSRRYQDQTGEWRSAQSFGRDHLLLVAKLCDHVHSWIYQQTAKDASPQADAPEADDGPEPGQDTPF
jgi:hypothetical protein